MCCVQGVVDITMAKLPTMPFTHGGGGDFCMQISVNLQRVADFGKSANGGQFLQAHVGNCPVADFEKSAYWVGGNSATRFQNYRFVSSTDFV